MEAMAYCAKNYGLSPIIVSAEMIGRSIEAADVITEDILKGEYAKFSCLLYGGETTAVLPENYGRGGRNQHLAALIAIALKDKINDWVFASLASDGRDFLKGIAGAIVDGNTLRRARAEDVDFDKYVADYDTNTMFKKIGQSLIKTDETGTNVGDLVVYLQ
jgi:glycerate 2-kinase